jgi:translocation and assembly module TamB
MPLGKGQRKLIWALGGSIAGMALLLVLFPLWFPWILPPLAGSKGVHYTRYQRLGYNRLTLDGVSFTNPTCRIHAAHFEAFVPTVWLWNLVMANNQEPFVRVEEWQFEVLTGSRKAASAAASVYDEANKLAATFTQLQRWLPSATLSNGTFVLNSNSLSVSSVALAHGVVSAEIGPIPKLPESKLSVQLRPGRPFTLGVQGVLLRFFSVVNLTTNLSGLDLQSTTSWWSNRIELIAHFGTRSALPERAELKIADFVLPGNVAGIPGYQNLVGSLAGNWQTGSFALKLNARGQSLARQTNLPPVNAILNVQGDTNGATVQALDITGPAFAATLSKPLTVYFRGPPFRESAELRLTADLAGQHWLPINGNLTGTAAITPTGGQLPRARVHFSGAGIGYDTIKTRTFALDAQCLWPLLRIFDASASFDDGSAANLAGTVDLQKKSTSEGSFRFNGPLARRWLPKGYSYGNLEVSGHFNGPLNQLSHSGHLQVDSFTSPQFRPLGLELDWQGQHQRIENFQANVFSANASLLARGALTLTNGFADLELSTLSFSTYHHPQLELREPVRFFAVQEAFTHTWQAKLAPLQLQGPAGQISCSATLDWPDQGLFKLSVRDLSSSTFADVAKTTGPETDIHALVASASWTNGPVDFALELLTSVRAAGDMHLANPSRSTKPQPLQTTQPGGPWQSLLAEPVAVELKVAGDRNGITLSNLVIKAQGTEVVSARGFVPITFQPGATTNGVRLERPQPLKLTAEVQPQAAVWDRLKQWIGVTLEQPELKLSLSGSWQDLRSTLAFQAKQIALENLPANMPSIQNLHLTVELDRDQAQLTQGALQIQGQPVSLMAQIPLGENFWLGLQNKKLPDWQKAKAQLRIENAQLAAFEPLFPELLAPQGELDADLELDRGVKVRGTVNIHHARTRPLSDLGPIRDINVKLIANDRLLELQNASATIGGAPVVLSGGLNLSGTDWLRGALPPFEISLQGTDVPLSRQTDSVIRSDLHLEITKTNAAAPLISGVARLKDSFYLSDLNDLVPGKVASPSARPPYFSIQEPPLADWRLAVKVSGARFLRVRSPVFNGEVSADLTLSGTLKDPTALGDVKIDSGIFRFPFANLQVQQGLVNLTSEDPYQPHLQVSAISKQFGYDIRMEVSGTAEVPIIQFTSNPPLSSEQILLLVTAGQMPQGTYTLTPQQRAQTVAMFLGGDVLSKLGFGDQTQQRLTIHSGEEISTEGKLTYNVEYKFTDRWAVTGEYDRFGDYNVGLKWRIYSK